MKKIFLCDGHNLGLPGVLWNSRTVPLGWISYQYDSWMGAFFLATWKMIFLQMKYGSYFDHGVVVRQEKIFCLNIKQTGGVRLQKGFLQQLEIGEGINWGYGIWMGGRNEGLEADDLIATKVTMEFKADRTAKLL